MVLLIGIAFSRLAGNHTPTVVEFARIPIVKEFWQISLRLSFFCRSPCHFNSRWFRQMATAKSLKKLRSVSNAFLDDGSSLLHGVDSLLRDLQQSLVDLQRREEILVGRELALEAREESLNAIIQQLADNVSSAVPSHPTPSNESESVTSQVVASTPAEAKVAIEVAAIQSAVTEVVSLTPPCEPPVAAATLASNQRTSQRRKKRRW